jgi:hypothetical protein
VKRSNNSAIAAIIAVFVFTLLLSSAGSIGLTWDEPINMETGERAARWLGLFAQGKVSEAFEPIPFGLAWGLNNEHPPLTRVVTGLGWAATRTFLPLPTSQRVGAMALNAFCLALIALLTARQRGWPTALFAVGAVLSMPRLFFHAHLAAIDFPLAAVWMVATLVFHHQITLLHRQSSRLGLAPVLKATLMIGIWLGLALLTKINAVLLLPYWFAWLLCYRRLWRYLPVFLLVLPVALAVLIAGWPWIWRDPLHGLWNWVEFFRRHYEIRQWFAGQLYLDTPWYLPPVLVAITTPLLTLLLAIGGVVYMAGRRLCTDRQQGYDSNEWEWLGLHLVGIAVNLFYYGFVGRIHDQDRLMLPLFFHLGILSSEGFHALWALLAPRLLSTLTSTPPAVRRWSGAISWLAAALLLWPGVGSAVHLHPYQLAYYNTLTGGVKGARARDLETIYFASSYAHFLPQLQQLPPGSKLWVMPNSWDVIYYYQLHGLLPDDLVLLRPSGWGSFYDDRGVRSEIGGLENADYALIERRQTAFNRIIPEYAIQLEWAQTRPLLAQLEFDGVVLATLHAKQ